MDMLLDHLPIGYFRIRLLYDSDGRAIDYLFLSVNRAAQQIVGIEPDAYIGKDGTRDRAPRRCPYRQTRAHPPRQLQDRRMVREKNQTPLPQFPVPYAQRRKRDCDPDPRHHRRHNGTQGTGRAGKTAAQHHPERPRRHRDLQRPGTAHRHQHLRPGDVRGERSWQNTRAQPVRQPNFPEETKIRIPARRKCGFHRPLRIRKTRRLLRNTRPRAFRLDGGAYALYDDRGELTHYLLINIDNTELRQIQNRVSEFEALFRIISEYAQVGYANYNLYNKEGYAQNVWLRNYGEADSAQIVDVIGKYRHIHPEDRKILLESAGALPAGEVQSARPSAACCTTTAGKPGSRPTSSAGTTAPGNRSSTCWGSITTSRHSSRPNRS